MTLNRTVAKPERLRISIGGYMENRQNAAESSRVAVDPDTSPRRRQLARAAADHYRACAASWRACMAFHTVQARNGGK